jgi:hypothetical protein
MSKFVGRLGNVGVAKEATSGTIVTPTFYVPFNTISFDDKVTTAREEEGLGRIEDSDSNYVVNKYGEGDLEFDLNDLNLGVFLTSLLGASPTTTGGPTYAHAYALANTNTHKTVSLAYQDPDQTKIFPFAMVDGLEITVEPEGIAKAKASFKSRVSRDWSTLTPSYTTLGNKFLHQHLVFKTAASTAGLAAASAISLKKLTLKIMANTEFDNVMGTVEPEAILNHQYTVEGEITLNKQDDTYRQLMLAGTYKAIQIKFDRATNSSLDIQLPRVDFTEWEQDRSLDDIVGQTIQFKGNYDSANAAAVISTCTLTNTNSGANY